LGHGGVLLIRGAALPPLKMSSEAPSTVDTPPPPPPPRFGEGLAQTDFSPPRPLDFPLPLAAAGRSAINLAPPKAIPLRLLSDSAVLPTSVYRTLGRWFPICNPHLSSIRK